jgi:methylmalonyl-CoA/ethylmalonyl-CoA epimerase
MSTTAADSTHTAATYVAPERVGQIAVLVHDVERATAFYRDVLGLRFLFSAPPGLAFFDCGGVRLMLGKPEGESGGTSTLYYVVPDIGAAYDALRTRGATFIDAPHLIAPMPDHDLWMCFLRDSEGNVVGLMSEVRPPAPR